MTLKCKSNWRFPWISSICKTCIDHVYWSSIRSVWIPPWWLALALFPHRRPDVKDSPSDQAASQRKKERISNLTNCWGKWKISDKSSSLPCDWQAHMFAPRSPLQGLLQLSTRLGVQVKRREGKKGRTRTRRQMMRFSAGAEANPAPHPVCLALIRVEAWMCCINILADVYSLPSAGGLSGTDCVSLAATHRCWHIDRWDAGGPPGLPLMASMRMDGLRREVQSVISQPAAYRLNDPLAKVLSAPGK